MSLSSSEGVIVFPCDCLPVLLFSGETVFQLSLDEVAFWHGHLSIRSPSGEVGLTNIKNLTN